MAAALLAISPYPTERFDPACSTRPAAVEHSASGTFQVWAAALTSNWRPAAPTRRIGSQLNGVAKLPPANWSAYFVSSKSVCSIFTRFQSASSSSAISIGSMVLTPWPTSGSLAMIVTVPSASILMKLFGTCCTAGPNWAEALGLMYRPSSTPPPASEVTRKNERRLTTMMFLPPLFLSSTLLLGAALAHGDFRRFLQLAGRRDLGRFMNRLANANVGSAAAKVTIHGRVDVLIGGLGRLGEQCRGGHHLSSLAIAALRDVDLQPSELQWMGPVRRKSFERRDRRFGGRGDGRLTAPHGLAVQVHRARAALSDAAAVLGPFQLQNIADHPQQGHIRGYIDGAGPSVYCQLESHDGSLLFAIRASYHSCF